LGARSKARKRALDVLYQADLMGTDLRETLQARIAQESPPMPAYAVELVEGVIANVVRIDELLRQYAQGWELERMPAVDRTVLRLGAYELLWRDDVPEAVAISEAVELATSLSTDESPKFVNGILGSLARVRPTLSPPTQISEG
jgi:N utilization substance protein B